MVRYDVGVQSIAIARLVGAILLWAIPGAGLAQESELVADGRLEFRQNCVTCHGTEGKGDGFMKQFLTVEPADLTQISKKYGGTFPFWHVYRIIDGREDIRAHGTREMPIWGNEFLRRGAVTPHPPQSSPEEYMLRGQIWSLVLYLESIQEK